MRAQPSTSTWPAPRLTAAVAVTGLGVTLLVVLLPFVRFAYEAPALHIALETAEALIALVVAYLALGRFRESSRAQDLLLACGLSVLAIANLVLTAVPSALALSGGSELSRWTPLLVRLFGTLLLVLAALSGPDRRLSPDRTRARVGAGIAIVVALVAAGLALGASLPPAVDPDLDLGGGRVLLVAGHPLVLGAQVLTGLLYALCALAFTRQAQRGSDELVRWLGPACAVAAVARVGYLLFPSLYSQYVCIGDVLRLAFYVLLLVGAAREVRSYWARAAVQEDRRRLARDLHDGLTQELTYIYAQSRLIEPGADLGAVAGRISGAAGRALDEARGAIAALTTSSAAGFYDVLMATTDGLGSRYDATLRLQMDEAVPVTPQQADAVLRILAEAFRNAVLHGSAAVVTVELSGPPLLLTVSDDGQGFGSSASKSTAGFGLTSMRERASSTGAVLAIDSTPGRGTTVTVVWP